MPMEGTWDDVKRILETTKTIAVVGLSDKPDRDSYQVAAYLQQQGYRIIPVNPRAKEVLGEKAYASLPEIPEPVEVVQIFRRSEEVLPIVEDAIAVGAKVIWMQSGIVNEEAAARAEAAGLKGIMDARMRSGHRAPPRPRGDLDSSLPAGGRAWPSRTEASGEAVRPKEKMDGVANAC